MLQQSHNHITIDYSIHKINYNLLSIIQKKIYNDIKALIHFFNKYVPESIPNTKLKHFVLNVHYIPYNKLDYLWIQFSEILIKYNKELNTNLITESTQCIICYQICNTNDKCFGCINKHFVHFSCIKLQIKYTNENLQNAYRCPYCNSIFNSKVYVIK